MANNLTASQKKVALVLSKAVATYGFAMGGGAALNAIGLSGRLSDDIDSFSSTCADVSVAAAAAAKAFTAAGWDVETDREGRAFCRLVVTTGRRRRTQVVVELGQDSIMWGTQETSVGPTLTMRELAANKVLAAFGRIKPRDLCDLALLADHLPIADMLRDAKAKDDGFLVDVLAEMVERTIARPDREWPPEADIEAVRAWSRSFAQEALSTDLGIPKAGADPARPASSGWVAPYQRKDGTPIGGYRRGPG